MFNKITELEREGMVKYIEEYATGGKCMEVTLEYLLRFWSESKQTLFNTVMNQNLILEKEVFWDKGLDELAEEMSDIFGPTPNEFMPLPREKARHFLYHYFNKVIEPRRKAFTEEKNWKIIDKLYDLIDPHFLSKNIYDFPSFELENPKDPSKPIKVQSGSKITRVLGKIAKAYDIEGYEDFRIAHSQVLNQKKIQGTLCLSIHPLDYMTMSDNDSDWQSCMNWRENGCYRQGTVEMMNSQYVIVAYLKSKRNMALCVSDETGEIIEWSNKKWRELYVVSPKVITNIKSYPYDNDNLTKITLSWLKELAEKSNYAAYHNEIVRYRANSAFKVADTTFFIDYITEIMYNDFHNTHYNLGYVNAELVDSTYHEFYINYSGKAECMICGEDNPLFADESSLICRECDGLVSCYCCEEFYDLEEMYEVDGQLYCSNCYYDYVVEDTLYGRDHAKENCYKIYLVDKEDHKTIGSGSHIYIFKDEFTKEELEPFFKTIRSVRCGWNETKYFVYQEDCTQEGYDLFEVVSSRLRFSPFSSGEMEVINRSFEEVSDVSDLNFTYSLSCLPFCGAKCYNFI